MPSRSEGWGGLFKDDQYRLIKVRFASLYKEPLRGTLNSSCCFALSGSRCAPPRLRLRRSHPSLLRRRMAPNPHQTPAFGCGYILTRLRRSNLFQLPAASPEQDNANDRNGRFRNWYGGEYAFRTQAGVE
jgi:hypothetical protein